MIKKILITVIIFIAIIGTAGCAERAADNEQVSREERIIIRFSHVVAESTPKGLAVKRFARLVDERTDGRVEVQVYPNSKLYKDGEEYKALLENNVQMIAPATAKLTEWFPRWQLFDLPFLFDSYDDVHRAMDGEVGEQLFAEFDRANIIGLAMWDNGFKQMSATSPLVKVRDFRGLTFRIMPSRVLASQFHRLGASVKELPFNEVYRALQQGEVDGAENPPSNFFTKKFYQVQPHLTISNHGYMGYVVLTNKDFWNGLPADIRKILEETLAEVTLWERQEAQAQNVQVLENLERLDSVQIHYLGEDKEYWRSILEPIYKEYAAEIGEDLIDRVRAD